ncbi:Hypothetical protein PENO1_022090 [Penicillium occitanis (nom. inval.)]|nr:hypothetical protein PENOC_032560 [Penicillium occitanis (nom. inval.)]PCH05548.1 Hypothetical protein PENO1_022090 [Penicillium occitanis (nom. inval.)]
MDYPPFVMEVDGASRTQAPPPAHTHRGETEEYSSQPPEASSSTLERPQSSVEANPSVVGESATGNSQIPLSPTSLHDRILQQSSRIAELVNRYWPGHSADLFFEFYKQQTGKPTDDMASRSGIREGLRNAPKTHQPFVPSTAPARQTRSVAQLSVTLPGTPGVPHFPATRAEGSTANTVEGEATHFTMIDTPVGEETFRVSTKDVPTPGNRPEQFRSQGKETKQFDYHDPLYPLHFLEVSRGFDIYRHVLQSIQCPDPYEHDWALFHLVQISNTRGDKFRFEGFPMLAESLMEHAMGITELLTGVKWELEHDFTRFPLKKHRINVLNSFWGTDDILMRIKKLPITLPDDSLEDADLSSRLRRIKEATLVLRNMCLLPANASYLTWACKGLVRDFLCVMTNLPNQPRFNELKNDALDIAEEVVKYMRTAPWDPLCRSLYQCTMSRDRAHIIRALGAIIHFSSEVPDTKNQAMVDIPRMFVSNLATYFLMEPDPELLSGIMDFFYQYTLDPVNAQKLPKVVNMTINVIPRLVNLLSYEAVEVVEEMEVLPEQIAPASTTIPKVPPELSRQLMALAEPERSSQWLRCCFAEDPECEITQIALWQAYQMRFGSHPNALAAAEFIKNVSATFTNAQAQVVPSAGPNGQTSTRFIIRGIRPLETALTFDGWPYLYCEWKVGDQPCDRAFADPQELRNHVFIEHTDGEAVEQSDRYNFDKAKQSPKACLWDGCSKYKTPTTAVMTVINHISSHLPQPRDPNARPPTPQRKVLQHRVTRRQNFRNTPVNELREPVGVAYKAALILRNLAVNLPENVYVLGENPFDIPKKDLFLARFQTIVQKCVENRSLSVILNEVIFLIQTIPEPTDRRQ